MRASLRPFAFLALVPLLACGGPPARTRSTRARVERPDPPLPPLPWNVEATALPALETPLVALVGGTVMTAAGQVIEDGVVVLDDGLIQAVGPRASVSIPQGARVIDATGRFVTPGVIDVHSHMGVYPVPSVGAHDDGNEATSPTTPQVRAADSFWPQDPALGRALAAGVTTIQVLPGSANLIGGAGETIHMHPGRTVTEMMFPGAPDTMKMACGENPKRVYGEQHQAPSTRMGNVAGYRAAFQEAIEYGRTWEHWQREHQAWARDREDDGEDESEPDIDGETGAGDDDPESDDDSDTGPPDPPTRNFGHELVLGAMQGRVLVQMHCYRADEMARMIEVGHEMGFRVRSFHHAVEAYKIRDLLHDEDISISTWADWWGFKLEAFDAIPENLGLLTQAHVRGVLHSDSPMLVQRLNQEVGKAVTSARAHGVAITDDEALRWITANAAWTLGIEDRVGTLEAGRVADVVVWSAHPFSVYAHADLVFVDGVLEHDRSVDPVGRRSDFEVGLDLEPRTSPPSPPHPTVADGPRPTARTASGLDSLVITHVRVLTGELGDRASVDDATVHVSGERITRIEPHGAAPASTDWLTVIDGTGLVLTPGFIALETHLGMAEIDLEPSTRDTSHEADAEAIHAAFTAADGYNPLSTLIPVARMGGVVAALSTPEGGLVSGTSSFVDLAGRDRSAVRDAEAALHVDLNEGGLAAAHGARPAALQRLRELLDDARLFARQRAAFDRAEMRETGVSRLDLERVAEALEGALPVIVRVSRAADILGVLALAEEYELHLVLSGVEEGWMVAESIARANVPVVVQPLGNLPSTFASLHTRFDNASLLAQAGVRVAIYEPGAWDVHNLRQEAGNAVAWGMPADAALSAITRVPAEIAGQGADYGVLAPGRLASMVLWNGDPFETTTLPVHLYVRGRELPLRSRQSELFDRYRDLSQVRRGTRGLPVRATTPE
ncbi:MAG: amidohydrolase family protein [Sandaracinus sp.]